MDGPWLQDHLQSDRDVLVAREVVDILTSSSTPIAAAVIAADARAGWACQALARPSALLGQISGGRINGGAAAFRA